MPLDEFIHDVRDKGTWISRFSAESIQVLARGSRPVALNNAQETIVEQSMSYRAGTERDSGVMIIGWRRADRDRSASTALSRTEVNALL